MKIQKPLKDFTDIELMTIIRNVNQQIYQLDSDLKLLNEEYNKRCDTFIKKAEEEYKEEIE